MKRTKWILLAVCLFLTGCSGQEGETMPPRPEPSLPAETIEAEATLPEPTPQLLARAETTVQAEEIARLYGITLVELRRGIAAFYTSEDPEAVMARREEGWPELYHNNFSKAS